MEIYRYKPEESDLVIGIEEALAWDEYLNASDISDGQRERIQLAYAGLLEITGLHELDIFRLQEQYRLSATGDQIDFEEDFDSDDSVA